MGDWTQEMTHIASEIGRYVEQRRVINDNLGHAVQDALNAKMTWRQIGMALGTSGQGAWEKYGLTPEQKEQRSRQNTPAHSQPALIPTDSDDPALWNGLEPTEGHSKNRKNKKS